MPYHLFIQTDEGALDYRGSPLSREEGEKGLRLAEQHHLKAMLVEEVGSTSRRINFQEADLGETVTISKIEYVKLIDAYEFLGYLEANGVNNWEGYEDAQEMMCNENLLLEQGEGGNA